MNFSSRFTLIFIYIYTYTQTPIIHSTRYSNVQRLTIFPEKLSKAKQIKHIHSIFHAHTHGLFSLSERIFVRKIHTTSIVTRDAPPWVDQCTHRHPINFVILVVDDIVAAFTLNIGYSILAHRQHYEMMHQKIHKHIYNINSLTYTLTSYTCRNEKSKRQWMKFLNFIWVVGKFFQMSTLFVVQITLSRKHSTATKCTNNERASMRANDRERIWWSLCWLQFIYSIYDGVRVCIVLAHISLSFSIHFRESSMKKRDG